MSCVRDLLLLRREWRLLLHLCWRLLLRLYQLRRVLTGLLAAVQSVPTAGPDSIAKDSENTTHTELLNAGHAWQQESMQWC